MDTQRQQQQQQHIFEFLRYPSQECDRLVISFCVECHKIIAASPRMENLEIVEDLHQLSDVA